MATWLAEQYTRMALEMDSCTIAPLDFSTVTDQSDEGFDETMAPNADYAVAYKFDVRQTNIGGISAAIESLKAGDGAAVLDGFFWVDSTYLASCFSRDVYEFAAIEMMDPNRDDLYWVSGKVPEQLNTYDAYHAISDKVATGATDYADEIAMLEGLLDQELQFFDEDIAADTEIVNGVNEILANSPLADDLAALKALL